MNPAESTLGGKRAGIVLFAMVVLLCVFGAAGFAETGNGAISTWRLAPEPAARGGVHLLTVTVSTPGDHVSGSFMGTEIPFEPADDGTFQGLVGIDLGAKPGDHLLTLRTSKGVSAFKVPVEDRDFGVRRFTVKESKLTPELLQRIDRETNLLEELWKRRSPRRLWKAPFIRPVSGKITGTFGKASFINGKPRSPHSGVDFRADRNENILCSNDGTAVLVKDLYYAGNSVFVDHGQGLYTMYFHLDRPLVREGATVRRGQPVGLAGSTGRSTGVHLHWGVRLNGARVDPLELIRVTEEAMVTH